MAWPPPIPSASRTNATPQLDTHPADHVAIANALTELVKVEHGATTHLKWARSGNVVTVAMSLGGQPGQSAGHLPAALAPADDIYFTTIHRSSSGVPNGNGSVRVRASGEVFQDSLGTVTAGGIALGTFTYVIGANKA